MRRPTLKQSGKGLARCTQDNQLSAHEEERHLGSSPFSLTLGQVARLGVAVSNPVWYLWLNSLAHLLVIELGIAISTDDLAGSDTRVTAF